MKKKGRYLYWVEEPDNGHYLMWGSPNSKYGIKVPRFVARFLTKLLNKR